MQPLKLIEIKSSKFLTIFFCSIHVGAAICILVSDLSLITKEFLVIFSLIGFIIAVYRYVLLLSPQSIIAIYPEEKGLWRVCLRNGKILYPRLKNHSVITRYFMILNFTGKHFLGNRTLILCRDSLLPELFWRLHIYLRFEREKL